MTAGHPPGTSNPAMDNGEARREQTASRLAHMDVSEANPPGSGRRLHIVHCLDGLHPGGTELNAVRTLESLDRGRFDLSLVVLDPSGPLRERVEAAGIAIRAFPIPNMYGMATARQARRLTRWLKQSRADVVHSHDCYTNIFATACARLARVPFVMTSRRWWDALPRKSYAVGNRWAYRLSDQVLANSDAVARLVRQETGLPEHRVTVVPNFLDDDAFEPVPDPVRAEQLAELGVPEGGCVVGVVARLRPEKDIESLIRAVAGLGSLTPAVHLVLVGDGPCLQMLRDLAASLGIADRVHFAGYRPNRPNLHLLFDISVLCSLHEGFPNSVIEAMAAARPVVATAVGGIPDAVEDGVTGFLVPARSPDQLGAAIARLHGDTALRARLGGAGRLVARERYHRERVLPLLESLYTAGVRDSGARPR